MWIITFFIYVSFWWTNAVNCGLYYTPNCSTCNVGSLSSTLLFSPFFFSFFFFPFLYFFFLSSSLSSLSFLSFFLYLLYHPHATLIWSHIPFFSSPHYFSTLHRCDIFFIFSYSITSSSLPPLFSFFPLSSLLPHSFPYTPIFFTTLHTYHHYSLTHLFLTLFHDCLLCLFCALLFFIVSPYFSHSFPFPVHSTHLSLMLAHLAFLSLVCNTDLLLLYPVWPFIF